MKPKIKYILIRKLGIFPVACPCNYIPSIVVGWVYLLVEIRDVTCFHDDYIPVCMFAFIWLIIMSFPKLCYKYVCELCML